MGDVMMSLVQRLRLVWRVLCGEFSEVPDDAQTFIQWKGTRVCMDVTCPTCGGDDHVDAEFAYFLFCHECGTVLEVGQEVTLVPVGRIGESGPWSDLERMHDELHINQECDVCGEFEICPKCGTVKGPDDDDITQEDHQ